MDFKQFLLKQYPVCTNFPLYSALFKDNFGLKSELSKRSIRDFGVDMFGNTCVNADLCRGGNICFGRPLPNYPEISQALGGTSNLSDGKYKGKEVKLIKPTFCTTIDSLGNVSSCPFLASCTKSCATMESRLDLESSQDGINFDEGLDVVDHVDYDELRYEHKEAPVESKDDICWYGVSDLDRTILELYDLWAKDYEDISTIVGKHKHICFKKHQTALKILQRNARVCRLKAVEPELSLRDISNRLGISRKVITNILRYAELV